MYWQDDLSIKNAYKRGPALRFSLQSVRQKDTNPIPELDTNKWFIQHSFTKLFDWFWTEYTCEETEERISNFPPAAAAHSLQVLGG